MDEDAGVDSDGFTVTGRVPRLVVLNDAPVDSGHDLMDGRVAARRLAGLITESAGSTPFTLAVDAAWGMGKSSLLTQLAEELAKLDVERVWFNAWTGGSAGALEGLVKSVLLSFDRNRLRKAVRSLGQRRRLLHGVRIAASVAASFVGQGRMVDDIWRVFATDARSRNEIKNVVRDALEGWVKSGKLLVVFVDDLDRCPADRIIEVCEAIKLYLDVPGLVFVLACDQTVLRRAVRESAGATEAVEYLEKIIQLNYRIPAPSQSTAAALVGSYLTRSGTASFFDDDMRSLVIERTGRNPRRIKRLINSFVLEYQLTPEWSEFGAENLIKVILLQHFYPSFYRDLVDPRTGDPAEDFLHYVEFRTSVRQGNVVVHSALRELFTANDLTPPTDIAGADELAELEKQLPEEFTRLAVDRDFVSLMRSMREALRSDMLRRLLRKPLNQPILTSADELTGPDLDVLAGKRVLWIDDHPHGDTGIAAELVQHGVQLRTATGRADAVEELARRKPDVMLSDITRGSDSNAGLDDLAYFRSEHMYDGPVIFYTGSISAARRLRAEELDASITTEGGELLRLLVDLAGRR